MSDHDSHRRAFDHGMLPSELFEFPTTDNPALDVLLRQVVHMLDNYTMLTKGIDDRLGGIERMMEERTATLLRIDRKLDNLKTAITVSGIVETGKAWAPIITILTALVAVAWWLREHLNWNG